MANLYNFPTSLPFQSAVDLANIVRRGELVAKRGEALQHVAWLTGSIGVKLGSGEVEALSECDCPDDLEGCAECICPPEGEASAQALNPLVAAAIRKLIKLVIAELL